MERLRKFAIFFFIALITIVNVNFYHFNNVLVESTNSIESGGAWAHFESANSTFFSFIEQRTNAQIQLSNFQKNSIKIALPEWSISKILTLEKQLNSEIFYEVISKIIVPGLESLTIIFPFHYFW